MRLPPASSSTRTAAHPRHEHHASSSTVCKTTKSATTVPHLQLRHTDSFTSSCATMVTSNCHYVSNACTATTSTRTSPAAVTPDRIVVDNDQDDSNDDDDLAVAVQRQLPMLWLENVDDVQDGGAGIGMEVCLTSSFVSMHLGSVDEDAVDVAVTGSNTQSVSPAIVSPTANNTSSRACSHRNSTSTTTTADDSARLHQQDDDDDEQDFRYNSPQEAQIPQPIFCSGFMSIGDSITDLLLFKPPSLMPRRKKKGAVKQNKSSRPTKQKGSDSGGGSTSSPQCSSGAQSRNHQEKFGASSSSTMNVDRPPISPKAAAVAVGSPPRSRSSPAGPFLIPTCGAGSYQDTPTKAVPFECGKVCCGADLVSPEVEKQRSMERNIGNMLGSASAANSSSPWCGSWQAWSLSFCDGSALSPDTKPEQLGRVLRNRAGNLNSQVRRIRRLHGNATHLERSMDLKKPGSFDERLKSTLLEDLILREQKRSQKCPSECTTSACSSAAGSAASTSVNAILTIAGCELREEKEKVALRTNLVSLDADDLYYDSDPEFITSRSRRGFSPKPTGHLAKRATASIHDVMDLAGQVTFQKSPSAASALQHRIHIDNVCLEKFVFNPNNLYQVELLIKETINRCMVLIWHPTPSKGRSTVAPVRVKAWVELGTQLRTRLVQPKFVWKIMTEEEIQGTKSCVSNKGLQKTELLDILRVLEVNEIDRKKYPFAKKCSSLMIETLTQTLFFEAESAVARDKLVVGLKLVIARLGSKIVTGDESVFDEFFSPFGNVDPGRPPSMFQ
mmetsp:Transcript_24167/g.37262  ORF Transcript_24167/g.37262 Transcript_24167/m.37262 type:complete len:785 (+) Transcript_24167:429-2783(+)